MNRAQGYWIAGNVFRVPALFALQSVASRAGGYPKSPASVTFDGNRVVHTNTGGLLLDGASTNLPELWDQLDAVVRNNDPVLGPCAADTAHELLNNVLIYNGQVLSNVCNV